MKRILLLSFLCLTATFSRAEDESDSKAVVFSDTPASVQKTVKAQVADGKLEGVEMSNRNDEAVYVATITAKDGEEHDYTVADDGTLLSYEIGLLDAPAPVQKTIHALITGWELVSIDKNLDDAEVSYDVEASKDDKTRIFSVGENGKTLSIEITMQEAPELVLKAIQSRLGAGKVKTITKIFDEDGISYDVVKENEGGAARSFSISESGKALSEQVSLEEVTEAARKTIRQKIAGGKILRIDKSLSEKKDGVLPYEIQGRKAGKPFDFSVGPKGRFLGMD